MVLVGICRFFLEKNPSLRLIADNGNAIDAECKLRLCDMQGLRHA